MRKTVLTAVFSALCLAAGAQGMGDAVRYSTNDYYGTARSAAMGNAFTALGGDLGSITINPAGSAVNNFSQLTLTPGITLTSNRSTFYGDDHNKPSGNTRIGRAGGMSMPNVGFTMNFDQGRRRGLKNISFGVVMNSTGMLDERLTAYGTNYNSSYCGWLAESTKDLAPDKLSNNWSSDLGYKTEMIFLMAGTANEYIGATDRVLDDGTGIARPLDQMYGRKSSGAKRDLVLNLGFNFSDWLYLGMNLGLSIFDYNQSIVIKEAVNPDINPDDPATNGITFTTADGATHTTYFRSARYREEFQDEGSGAYMKFGAIVRPFSGLRIGMAFQTPTIYSITERYQYAAEAELTDAFNSAKSPEGEFVYRLKSPGIFNAGIAYTIPGVGLLSVDYESTNYGRMRMSDKGGDEYEFDDANADIEKFGRRARSLRIGAEAFVTKSVTARAGFNYMPSPYKDQLSNEKYVVAFGAGYDSHKSIFLDIAYRRLIMPTMYTYPYDWEGNIPEIVSKRNRRWDLMFTLGFRF